ncbi:MAG TPA: hypothetical protein VNR70_16065 [Steroidobacteraceae bacterium]|nr:hypothetical protein [Steroidobacteraceae bacterium]
MNSNPSTATFSAAAPLAAAVRPAIGTDRWFYFGIAVAFAAPRSGFLVPIVGNSAGWPRIMDHLIAIMG